MKDTIPGNDRGRLIFRIFLMTLVLATCITATGATITVTNTNDNGPGSLRQAIANATPGDTINFGVTGVISLTSAHLVIDKDVKILGPGASLLTVSDNSAVYGEYGVFYIYSGITAAISGVTISDGLIGVFNFGTLTVSNSIVAHNMGYVGGGFYNAGTLTIANSTISNNLALPEEFGQGVGGGISNGGILTVINSTIFGNRGEGDYGGGICQDGGTLTIINSTVTNNSGGGIASGGELVVINSTISGNTGIGGNSYGGGVVNFGSLVVTNSSVWGNTADNGGGGIHSFGASYETLTNTIVAGNTSSSTANDISGTIETARHDLIGDAGSSGGIQNGVNGNIVGADPLLGPLANNGGPTFTHALLIGSPAINKGDNCVLIANGCCYEHRALPADQRGGQRRGNVDIGAYEFSQ